MTLSCLSYKASRSTSLIHIAISHLSYIGWRHKDMASRKRSNPLVMSVYLLTLSYTVGMDDLASRLMTSKSCSSTTSVASYTKLSSPIYKKKEREIRLEKGAIKRGVSQDTNLYCQTVTCLLNHCWACRLPVQVKGLNASHICKVIFKSSHHSWVSEFPIWTLKRASGWSRRQVVFKFSRQLWMSECPR